MDVIITWLETIAERGVLERFFKYEGRFGDGVCAIPIDPNNLRLYCIRLSDKILIFGNGDVKDCGSWLESETLSEYVKILMDTSKFISSRVGNGTLYVIDKEIIGNLDFGRHETK